MQSELWSTKERKYEWERSEQTAITPGEEEGAERSEDRRPIDEGVISMHSQVLRIVSVASRYLIVVGKTIAA